MQWTRALREQTEQQLTALSNALHRAAVIWPELPAPLYFYDDPSFTTRRWRWRGATVFSVWTVPLRPRKSAEFRRLTRPDGAEAGRYDRRPSSRSRIRSRACRESRTQERAILLRAKRSGLPPQAIGWAYLFAYESGVPNLVASFTETGR